MEDETINVKIDKIVELMKASNYTILLSGAGVSTSSGIPDFRSETGLYTKYPSDVLSRSYFYNKTDLFYEAFHEKFSTILNAEPNEGHNIIAKWQCEDIINFISTQNIDGLHKKAISSMGINVEKKDLLKNSINEIHGTIETFTLKARGKKNKLKLADVLNSEGKITYRRQVDGAVGTYLVKPDVVLFGEQPLGYGKVSEIVKKKADLMIVVGTSLEVYPFAYLPTLMRHSKHVVIINKTPINLQRGYTVEINEDINEVLKIIDSKLHE
jgi:NAD-dependent protein deacetylases, SIR2 family